MTSFNFLFNISSTLTAYFETLSHIHEYLFIPLMHFSKLLKFYIVFFLDAKIIKYQST